MRRPSITRFSPHALTDENLAPFAFSAVSTVNPKVLRLPTIASSSFVKPVIVLPSTRNFPLDSFTFNKPDGPWHTELTMPPASYIAAASDVENRIVLGRVLHILDLLSRERGFVAH